MFAPPARKGRPPVWHSKLSIFNITLVFNPCWQFSKPLWCSALYLYLWHSLPYRGLSTRTHLLLNLTNSLSLFREVWAVDVLRHNEDHQCKTTKTSNISTEIFETKTVFLIDDLVYSGGTGVSELTRGLTTLPPRWIQEPVVVRDRDGRPPRGPSGSALLLCV